MVSLRRSARLHARAPSAAADTKDAFVAGLAPTGAATKRKRDDGAPSGAAIKKRKGVDGRFTDLVPSSVKNPSSVLARPSRSSAPIKRRFSPISTRFKSEDLLKGNGDNSQIAFADSQPSGAVITKRFQPFPLRFTPENFVRDRDGASAPGQGPAKATDKAQSVLASLPLYVPPAPTRRNNNTIKGENPPHPGPGPTGAASKEEISPKLYVPPLYVPPKPIKKGQPPAPSEGEAVSWTERWVQESTRPIRWPLPASVLTAEEYDCLAALTEGKGTGNYLRGPGEEELQRQRSEALRKRKRQDDEHSTTPDWKKPRLSLDQSDDESADGAVVHHAVEPVFPAPGETVMQSIETDGYTAVAPRTTRRVVHASTSGSEPRTVSPIVPCYPGLGETVVQSIEKVDPPSADLRKRRRRRRRHHRQRAAV